MTNDLIEALERAGCNRWTKGGYDRLYIPHEKLGLECEYYNTGNIRYAEFNGEKISNTSARELASAKTYIDISTGKIRSTSHTMLEAAKEFVNSIKEEEAC